MEDNPADVSLVIEALEEHSVRCDVVVLQNGESAIDYIDSMDTENVPCPDLLIVDLNLPRRSGLEVLSRMRASVRCQHVPVVILTSSDSQKEKDQAASLGASRFISKPSRLAEFLNLGAIFKEILHG